MGKAAVIAALIAQLEKRVEASRQASLDAASYATDAESKADSKWDTQGLEASYLAAGQATQAKETAVALQRLHAERDVLGQPLRIVEFGALIQVSFGGEMDRYFIAPVGGGEVVEIEEEKVTVLTPQSPLFDTLKGKVAGTEFALPSGVRVKVVSIG
jgi:hypothetical protein|tara:strand:- start:2257 stop:2727 length:471 start_codon:yes stop_codon:yes gene_type:complete